jgi:alpha-L-rhamnosidase
MRMMIDSNPFDSEAGDGARAGCRWIALTPVELPSATAYRCRLAIEREATARIHVTADERYELFLDGQRIGRGPERGDPTHWRFETYDLPLAPGAHVVVARVWSLGDMAPMAQLSAGSGLLVLAEPPFGEQLSTGLGPWEARRLDGYRFVDASRDAAEGWLAFTGPDIVTDAALAPWTCRDGSGIGWSSADLVASEAAPNPYGELPAHMLVPASLPAMLEEPRRLGTVRHVCAAATGAPALAVRRSEHLAGEVGSWQMLLEGTNSVTVPPHAVRHVVVDLENYYCLYPRLVASGGSGARIGLAWAETTYLDAQGRSKGRRDSLESTFFLGRHEDVLLLDGGESRELESPWWRAGRYLLLSVETSTEPATLDAIELRETRYPLETASSWSCDDERVTGMLPIAWRGLQMCAHETYVDCPYYEQLLYAGDTRLHALVTYTMSRDDRLARKALTLFADSRLPNGLTQSRYPSRRRQVIPPFSLWWVAMVHDYARWRGDRALVASLLPTVRSVIDAYLAPTDDGRSIAMLPGWSFVDWVPSWPNGVPPGCEEGANACIGWQLVLALSLAADLEQWAGDVDLAPRRRELAVELAGSLQEHFWDDARGMFADDPAKRFFSEHTQSLALLSGRLDSTQQQRVAAGLLNDSTLARCTVYFSHYLFEAYRLVGRIDALYQRLAFWFDLAHHGFVTTPETSDLASTRSDCHGWGAHPLYHLYASVLGVRPASFGFETVEIAPQLGPLQWVHARLIHPAGEIEAKLRQTGSSLTGSITLPDGISGVLRYGEAVQPLSPGYQDVTVVDNQAGS